MTPRPTEKVGALIRKARERRGMTQVDLSRRLCTSPPYVSMLECGMTKGVSGERLTEIANVLSVKRSELNEWLAAAGHVPPWLMVRSPKRWNTVRSVLVR